MGLRVNRQESIQSIEKYIADGSRTKNWRLVIDVDKKLGIAQLTYRKVTLLARLFAFFGFGNASFGNVIRFCRRAFLADQLQEGTLQALNGKIDAFAKEHICFKIEKLGSTRKSSGEMPKSEGKVLENSKIQAPKKDVPLPPRINQYFVATCTPSLSPKRELMQKLKLLPWIVMTPRGVSIRLQDNSKAVVGGVTPEEKKELLQLPSKLKELLKGISPAKQIPPFIYLGKVYKEEIFISKENIPSFSKALGLDEDLKALIQGDPLFNWAPPSEGASPLLRMGSALSSLEEDPGKRLKGGLLAKIVDEKLVIEIPNSQEELKERIQALFMLKEEVKEGSESNSTYCLEVPSERIASLFETVGLLAEFEKLKKAPTEKRNFLEVVGHSLKQYGEGIQLILHPRGWLSLRLENRNPALEVLLKDCSERLEIPEKERRGYKSELMIPEEKLPQFLEKMGLEGVVDPKVSFPKFQTFHADFGSAFVLDIYGTISRTIASIDPLVRYALTKIGALENPLHLSKLLPVVQWEEGTRRLSIFIPQELGERKIFIAGSEIVLGGYLTQLFGPPWAVKANGYEIWVHADALEEFCERELGLREFQGPFAEKYKSECQETTYLGRLLSQIGGRRPRERPHGSINPDNLALHNEEPKLPTVIPTYSLDEMLATVREVMGGGDASKAETAFAKIYNQFGAGSEQRKHLYLVVERLKNGSMADREKINAIYRIEEDCMQINQFGAKTLVCNEGVLSKLQGELMCLSGGVGGDIKTILLTEVGGYKDSLLTAVTNEARPLGAAPIRAWHVHIANAVKIELGQNFGFSMKAAEEDHYARKGDINSVYGHFDIKNCVDKFRQRYIQGAPEEPEGRGKDGKWRPAVDAVPQPEGIIAYVFGSLSIQKDERGSLRNASIYREALEQFLLRKGIVGAAKEKKLEELLPIHGETVSLTQEAVKCLLTHIGILNP